MPLWPYGDRMTALPERARVALAEVLDRNDPALRAAFAVVERECLEHDGNQGQAHSRNVINGWADQLRLLRG